MSEQPMCPSEDLGVCRSCSKKILMWTVAGNVVMSGLKLAGGVFTNSSGLIADGLQSLSCVATSILIMISLVFSGRQSDERFPFGYAKAEFIAALSAFSVLIGLGLYIVLSNLLAIFRREFVQPDIMALPIVVVSAFLTYMMYRYNFCAGTRLDSPGLVANGCHAGADLFSSGAVIVAILVAQIGPAFAICDKFAALIVGAIIVKDALGHWTSNLQAVLDQVPDSGFRRRIEVLVARDFAPYSVRNIKFRRVGKKFWLGITLQGPTGILVAEELERTGAVRAALTGAFAEIDTVDLYTDLGGG
ncbi:MAG: cation transporter [Candidatus Omnitrophica bacterium]|nr:cation transporter [Candidatus Omnitrophota bacterium]